MRRLLIVEDEKHLAFGLKFNFEAEGYLVELVGDGPAALSRFRDDKSAYDLVILDLMLPGMSGYDICSELRGISPDVPIIVLSARSLPEDRARAFDCGTDQYVTKPFDLRELLVRVRSLIDRRQRQPKQPDEYVYRWDECSVDFRRHDVTVSGKRRKLTTMELKLLELFVRHAGQVLTRAEILERVWGLSPPPSTRTVDNFVMRLRKHFEQDAAAPRYFVSVRGAGYQFRPQGGEPAPDDAATSEIHDQ